MWKAIARFIEIPIWKQYQSVRGPYGYYRAKLENKEGIFECSFGKKLLEDYSEDKKTCLLKCIEGSQGRFRCKKIEFLDNNKELTSWEEITEKDKQTKKSDKLTNQSIQIEEEIEELKSRLSRLEEVNNFLEKQTKEEEYQIYQEISPKSN